MRRLRLPRRAVLRAAGVSLGLPWLDAMVPALATNAEAAAALAPPKRLVVVNYGLGFHAPLLFPAEAGEAYRPTPYLELLAKHRDRFTVLSGLSHPEQAGANGHTSELTILTAAKHPGLPGFRNGISIDQFIADRLQPPTRFASLAVNHGGGDSISWTSTGVNLPAAGPPEKLFQMMFVEGTPREVEAQVADLKRGRSILDTVAAPARRLERTLGPRDRVKLEQYLASVRDLERRLEASQAWARRPKPQVDAAPPKTVADKLDFIARTRAMSDVIALALQTDSTRIITVKASAMNDVPKLPGVDTGWHDLSHHGQDEEKIEELRLIEEAEFREIDAFLTRLAAVPEGDGALLDATHVLLLSNLGNASSHSPLDLPVILAGGGLRHGRHVVAGGPGVGNARLSNLFVQLARRMGVEADRFGSSDGTEIPGLA
jgi:hypothetical protein